MGTSIALPKSSSSTLRAKLRPAETSGFNSFMGDAYQGWKAELFSQRLRQALAAELVATGEQGL